MPIYEYRCQLGHTFEVMQRMADDPIVSCQTCEAPVQRVFHPVAVHFKGSGFYNTDYGTRRRSRELAESGAEGGGKEGASDSKTDSKPETKSKAESGSTSSSQSGSTSSSESSPKNRSDKKD
jgi:putative FmdB family regulatory protein